MCTLHISQIFPFEYWWIFICLCVARGVGQWYTRREGGPNSDDWRECNFIEKEHMFMCETGQWYVYSTGPMKNACWHHKVHILLENHSGCPVIRIEIHALRRKTNGLFQGHQINPIKSLLFCISNDLAEFIEHFAYGQAFSWPPPPYPQLKLVRLSSTVCQ